jgi:hypothetical protein
LGQNNVKIGAIKPKKNVVVTYKILYTQRNFPINGTKFTECLYFFKKIIVKDFILLIKDVLFFSPKKKYLFSSQQFKFNLDSFLINTD